MGVRPTCPVCLELSKLSFLMMTCKRERLNESLPKNGEMLQPDEWYPATAKYFGLVEVPGPDALSSVSNQSEGAPYLSEPLPQQISTIYPSPEPSLYSTIVSDFLPPSPRAPLEKPSQETLIPGLPMQSMDQTFVGALPAHVYANQGYFNMPEDPQIQVGGGSDIDQTAVGNWVSYQTPDFIYALQQYFSTI